MEKKKEVIEVENVEKTAEVEKADTIQISDEVVAVIAGMTVAEVSGVAEMAGGFAGGISEVFSGKKNMAKGIKVEINDKSVYILDNPTKENILIDKNFRKDSFKSKYSIYYK